MLDKGNMYILTLDHVLSMSYLGQIRRTCWLYLAALSFLHEFSDASFHLISMSLSHWSDSNSP
jgi:hypothetical protein